MDLTHWAYHAALLLIGVGYGFWWKWYTKDPRICYITGVQVVRKKCPSCGGHDCLKTPAEVVPVLHQQFMWMQSERDKFRGRLLKPKANS